MLLVILFRRLKHTIHQKKIMVVQSLDFKDKVEMQAFLTRDSVQAGNSDIVLVMREDGSAQIVFNDNDIP